MSKRNRVAIFSMLSIVLSFVCSCQFSKGVKKDLATGLSASYNGLKVDDIYLADESGNRLRKNTIKLGSKVLMVVDGVDHFTEREGRVFPGCQIILTDKDKKEILNLADAFASLNNGTTPAEAKTLQASLNTGEPMATGETYHLLVRFYDKNDRDKSILSDVDLVMQD